jgi:hypothetical protein
MATRFLPKLSQNFIELLKDDEYYDITIEVQLVKIFCVTVLHIYDEL